MTNQMPVLMCAVLLLPGCTCEQEPKEVLSKIREEATIVRVFHDAAGQGAVSSVHVSDGDLGTFGVVFECGHGQYVIRRRDLFERFNGHQGKTAEVEYHELHRVTYVGWGHDYRVESELLDYDFINATLK